MLTNIQKYDTHLLWQAGAPMPRQPAFDNPERQPKARHKQGGPPAFQVKTTRTAFSLTLLISAMVMLWHTGRTGFAC
jgi:hypothetical protein